MIEVLKYRAYMFFRAGRATSDQFCEEEMGLVHKRWPWVDIGVENTGHKLVRFLCPHCLPVRSLVTLWASLLHHIRLTPLVWLHSQPQLDLPRQDLLSWCGGCHGGVQGMQPRGSPLWQHSPSVSHPSTTLWGVSPLMSCTETTSAYWLGSCLGGY